MKIIRSIEQIIEEDKKQKKQVKPSVQQTFNGNVGNVVHTESGSVVHIKQKI